MQKTVKKKRLLVSAYAVSPERGSECAVGWEITKRLGENFDVTVLMCEITPSNNPYYSEVCEELRNNGNKNKINYVGIPMPLESEKYTKLHDVGFWPSFYWGYKTWQKAAYKKAKEIHEITPFDSCYQLNMIGFREPGYLWKLNIPFFWGPTNGFHSIPFSFIKDFSGKEFIFQSLKHIVNKIQIQSSFRARKAAKKASLIWAVDKIAYLKLRKWSKNVEMLQETGLQTLPTQLQENRSFDGKRTLNIICSGMITTGKAYRILIDALLQLKDENFHLTVLGDGPLKGELRIKSKIIENKITWLGWVDRSIVQEEIKNSDIFVHPSLKEATSMAILESIGNGIPVICHDTCGMGIVVNDFNGYKIPYENFLSSTEYLSTFLLSIIKTPELLNNRFKSINECIEELTWDYKVLRISNSIESELDKK